MRFTSQTFLRHDSPYMNPVDDTPHEPSAARSLLRSKVLSWKRVVREYWKLGFTLRLRIIFFVRPKWSSSRGI